MLFSIYQKKAERPEKTITDEHQRGLNYCNPLLIYFYIKTPQSSALLDPPIQSLNLSFPPLASQSESIQSFALIPPLGLNIIEILNLSGS